MRVITTALLCSLNACTNMYPAKTAHRNPDFDNRIKELVSEGFRGQVLVAHHGKIVLDAAYGYADAGGSIVVTRATGFGVASVTKNFTAAAILKLREAGLLQMNTKLKTLLSNVPADKASITIEQLLSHTSGLGTTYAADGETDRALAETKLLAQPLKFDPGTDFKYSDDGYVLLAAIIEETSGRSYEAFLATELFKPAGMSDTYFWGTRDFGDPRQVAALQRELDPKLTRPQWGQRGSGGVISTAADLYRFWKALREGRMVSKLTADDLLRPRTVRPNGLGIGLGWFSSKT